MFLSRNAAAIATSSGLGRRADGAEWRVKQRSLKTNIAANVVGRLYTGIAGVVFVPVYLHFLGVAGYGLFALLNSYMAVAALLDLGFSGAITREIAKLSALSPERIGDLVWTISLPYCAATIIIASAIYAASPWIASVAIAKGSSMANPEIVRAVGLAGFGLTFQLPGFLYSGGLAGLQRQDIANGITIVSTTVRHGVAILLLWGVSNSVVTLMAWQAVIAVLTAFAALVALWSRLPSNRRRPRFRRDLLHDTWKFAASLGGLTILGTLVLQSDKILVGALLPLTVVGHYMVASVIATNLMLIAQPVSAAAFPRLSQLVAARDWAATYSTFEKLAQLVAVMALPVTATIAVFPEQTLMVWTGNAAVAQSAAPLLRYLVLGVSFNALASIPNELTVAMGRTTILLVIATVSCCTALALVYLGIMHFGPEGAALAMCVYFCMGLISIGGVLRHAFGRADWWRWLSKDVALPGGLVAALALLMSAIAPPVEHRIEQLALLAITWLLCALAAGSATPHLRHQALSYWRRIRARPFRSTR